MRRDIFSEEHEMFRVQVRRFVENELVPKIESWNRDGMSDRESWRKMGEAGFLGANAPAEYGGAGGDFLYDAIVIEELSRVRAHGLMMGLHSDIIMPYIATYGTEDLKRRYLAPAISGETILAIAMTEPGTGSDLAGMSTTAVLDGDHYVLNGQKVWTSMAHVAAWGFFLVRTDPTVAKHKGITFLLLDMKSPGLTIRPLRQITGEAEFNEVFLENVRVPVTNVVGKVNEGWGVALTTLAYERDVLTMIRHISLRTALQKLLSLARRTMKNGRPASEDPVVRQKIAALSIGERVLQLNGYRSLTKILRGGAPGPEGSTSKLFWSQLDQDLAEFATEVIGPYSQLKAGSAMAPDDGEWEFYCLLARGSGIRAGTTEILRNILGERVLGLPKD